MQKTIILNDIPVSYSVKRSTRSRMMRLEVNLDGSVDVTVPNRISEFFVARFMREKAHWILKKITYVKSVKQKNLLQTKPGDYEKYKEKTRILVMNRIRHFNNHYHFRYNRVAIRDQESRWGSCSAKKNLNFNYKLWLIPLELADYVIAHEVCHLKELNHSERFWKLLEETIPDYKKHKKQLGAYSLY